MKIRSQHRFLGVLMLVVFGLMVASLVPFAQTKTDPRQKLESKKKQLEQEIAYNKKLLEETGKNKKLSVNQLNLLKSQISSREALLDEINFSIDSLERVIRDNSQVIGKQEDNLTSLKEEYARMIYHGWKMRNSNDCLLFIFSAQDFGQAFQRIKYFQQYSEFRKKQASQIVSTSDALKKKVQELNAQKQNQFALLTENESERERLDQEKAEKDEMLSKLRQKEGAIKKTINAKKEEAGRLQKKIEAIIAAEIKKSSAITKKTATGNNVKEVLTPAEKVLSDNFINNMGKLPWPVTSGVVSGYFGEHDHPVLPGIKVKNNGVDISTTRGSSVRAVFNGTVVSVVSISENNKVVIIRHGDYFTVYSNLESTAVSKGTVITTRQVIGKVSTDPEEDKTEVHFEVWQGEALHNPLNWLAPR